jgi:uncharacterized protein YecE (DUF72 family)
MNYWFREKLSEWSGAHIRCFLLKHVEQQDLPSALQVAETAMNENMQSPTKISVPAANGHTGCDIMVGTCGYSYLEWVDSGFYPPETKSSEMLGLYGGCFPIVELNYTWYQMARSDALCRMADAAPPHLLFSAKLTRTITHDRVEDWRQQVKLYRQGITSLKKRLLSILVQLPPDFDRTINNRCFLAELLDRLHGLPVAVEFRHRSWAVDSVFSELERRAVSLVTVDEPDLPGLFPALDVVTNPALFYVRFHGRNIQGWRSGTMQKKFDYDYGEAELQQWCERYLSSMVHRSDQGIIFFNNHVRSQAPRNARLLSSLIRDSRQRLAV